MAKSTRSKSKRAFRRTKREEGVYAAVHAARLERLSSKLAAKVSADKDGDQAMEEEDTEEQVKDGSEGECRSALSYRFHGTNACESEVYRSELVSDSSSEDTTDGEGSLNNLELCQRMDCDSIEEDGDGGQMEELCHLMAGLNLVHDIDMEELCHDMARLNMAESIHRPIAKGDGDVEMESVHEFLAWLEAGARLGAPSGFICRPSTERVCYEDWNERIARWRLEVHMHSESSTGDETELITPVQLPFHDPDEVQEDPLFRSEYAGPLSQAAFLDAESLRPLFSSGGNLSFSNTKYRSLFQQSLHFEIPWCMTGAGRYILEDGSS
ncbi:hypothetical protein RhiXN_00303 [Rhizoctonia solani]|uniref:DUF2423 domain-containing protein n=1 Tax=Rhizoctonia solani TaxID=456999 RepID=A0A8H8SVW8_9AGAM|nr:uncharacterized protein RhiXN_00303 [Rhizoctonia solani]QRW18897.1 hypothetical protein RhiXN_00303 [Rhizoctonia solani]